MQPRSVGNVRERSGPMEHGFRLFDSGGSRQNYIPFTPPNGFVQPAHVITVSKMEPQSFAVPHNGALQCPLAVSTAAVG